MDLITDIFAKLPPKSLVRFKSLSKPCRSLIDDPDFVQAHLRNSSQTHSNLNLILKSLHLYTAELDRLDAAVSLDYPDDFTCPAEAFGTCDGLIALRYSEKNLALLNPSARDMLKLPVSPIDTPGDDCRPGYVFYGFGKDLKSNDYKIVRMVQFKSTAARNHNNDGGDGEEEEENEEEEEGGGGGFANSLFDYEVKVFSVKNRSWHKIRDLPRYLRYLFEFFFHLLHRRGYGVFANGVVHWVLPPRIELMELRYNIIGFDLSAEKFVKLPQPEYQDRNFLLDVGVLEGNLCAVCNYNQDCVDVWIMREYGVKESWTKLLSIQTTKSISSIQVLRPLAYSKEHDKILLEVNSGRLVWYDIGAKRIRRVKLSGAPDTFHSDVYVGSLVALNEKKELDDKPQEKTKKDATKKR